MVAAIAEGTAHTLFGLDFAGAADLAYPVVLSTARPSPEFRPRASWRGPERPVINWLHWWGTFERGLDDSAAPLRAPGLTILARPEAHLAEHFEPCAGEPLGPPEQPWRAAVGLDWLTPE